MCLCMQSTVQLVSDSLTDMTTDSRAAQEGTDSYKEHPSPSVLLSRTGSVLWYATSLIVSLSLQGYMLAGYRR